MTNPPISLNTAIKQYDKALSQLEIPSLDRPDLLQEQVLAVLAARDAVQATVDDAQAIPAPLLSRLSSLDEQLRQFQEDCRTWKQFPWGKQSDEDPRDIYPDLYQKIVSWRNAKQPPEQAWWWQFEPPALIPLLEYRWGWLDRLNGFWILLTLFFLAVSLTFGLNTLNRVLSGGIHAQGLFVAVLQMLLILTGGVAVLTQQGRQTLRTILTQWQIPRRHWQKFIALVTLIFLLIVVGIHDFYLPRLASNLHRQGVADYNEGRLNSALSQFQQTIALRPDYAAAHYSLGRLYEDLQQPDAAIVQYEQVVQSEADDLDLLTRLRANNHLGRLYILQDQCREKGNCRAAWVPLERGLSLISEAVQAEVVQAETGQTETMQTDPAILLEQYTLLKNLGWVHLQQKQYSEAAQKLREAIPLGEQLQKSLEADPNVQEAIGRETQPAAAYCLLAQVLEAQQQQEAAQPLWSNCIQYTQRNDPDEALWAGIAREKLTDPNAPQPIPNSSPNPSPNP